MEIRKAEPAELDTIMGIYAAAREFMIRTGNPMQWGRTKPARSMLQADIAAGDCYVITHEGGIRAVFVMRSGEDPTYRVIENGAWPDDGPYVTIHRIAGDPACKGVFATCLDWCWERLPNIRIDTHRDNRIMLSLLRKHGFTYCGIIYLADGAERLAFQRMADVERLRKDAKLVLPARCRSLAEHYGFTVNKVFIKHNRSNWGSCSAKGNINLNLNLARIPTELRDYVIVHELCHLRYLNHGEDFHRLLEALCVDLLGERLTDRPLHVALRRRLRGYWLV